MADDIGFIYLAVNDTMPGLVKIGYTRGDVQERMKELSAVTGIARPFRAIYFCEVQNPEEVERQLHRQFAYCHEGKEFFRTEWQAVKAALRMMQTDSKRVGEDLSDDITVSPFALVKYVKEGNADKVRQALAVSRCNPNQADENKQTALMWAAELGHAKIVGILMNGKADPNKATKSGRTALMLSAKSGHANIVKALLDYGANVNAAMDEEGDHTALTEGILSLKEKYRASDKTAEYSGEADAAKAVVGALLDGGAKPSDYDLGYAVEAGCVEIVKMLLDGGAKSSGIDSALRNAARAGHTGIVKMLLDGGAKSSGIDSALGNAAGAGHLGVVKMLLDGGAKSSDTALRIAASAGHTGIVKMLLDSGAKPSESALEYAAKAGHAEIVKMLLDSGAKPSESALWQTERAGHVDIVKMLTASEQAVRPNPPKTTKVLSDDANPLVPSTFKTEDLLKLDANAVKAFAERQRRASERKEKVVRMLLIFAIVAAFSCFYYVISRP